MAVSKTIAIVAMTLTSAFGRLASFASQVIVGWYLSEEQVGAYVVALGVMGITGVLRAGGMALYLPSVKADELDGKVPRHLAWSSAFLWGSGLATLVVAGFAPELATRFANFGLEGVQATLVLLAVRQFLTPLAMVARIRLSIGRQFGSLARIDSVSAVLRVAMTWIVAREGGGTLALAIPYCAQVIIDLAAIGSIGGIKRSDFRFRGVSLRQLAATLAWPLAASAAISIRSDVVFLLLGLVVPAASLGIFYFAFQLANQPTMLLAGALQNVLAPFQAEDRGNSAAERLGMERVFGASMLFVPATTVVTASLFPSLETLLWKGRWAAATPCLVYLCVGASYSTVVAIMTGSLIGLRRFKALAAFEATKIAGTVGGAVVGTTIIALSGEEALEDSTQATIVGACVGIAMGAVAFAQIAWIMRRLGTPASEVWRGLLFGPSLALLIALSAQSIGHSIRESAGVPADRFGAAIEFASIGLVYCLIMALAIRFIAENILRETIEALPKPAALRISRLLRLH